MMTIQGIRYKLCHKCVYLTKNYHQQFYDKDSVTSYNASDTMDTLNLIESISTDGKTIRIQPNQKRIYEKKHKQYQKYSFENVKRLLQISLLNVPKVKLLDFCQNKRAYLSFRLRCQL